MCTHCPGLRQNIHGPSDCVLHHGHLGDCSKTRGWLYQKLAAKAPPPPWFVPVIAELLPTQKTARELKDLAFATTYAGTFNARIPIVVMGEFMAAIDKGEF